jgi:DNA polymerase III subunit delta'
MLFSEVIAANTAKQQLLDVVSGERQPHAILLWGAPGSGTLPLALAYVQRSLCRTPKQDGDACGECSNCHKTQKFIHPDVHFSFPVTGANKTSEEHYKEWRQFLSDQPYAELQPWLERIGSDNQQGNINKAECQRIQRALQLKAYEGGRKILLMWQPEYLGNRLLKLIEEPPDDTLFVLVAENTATILPTILSRCQLLMASPLSDEQLTLALIKHHKLSTSEAESIASLAEGSYTEALQLMHDEQDDRSALFLDWMRQCYAGNGVHLVQQVDKLSQLGRERLKYFMRYSLFFLRELMIMSVTAKPSSRLRPADQESAQRLLKLLNINSMNQLRRLFDDCAAHIERNANPRTLLLSTSVYMHHVLRGN